MVIKNYKIYLKTEAFCDKLHCQVIYKYNLKSFLQQSLKKNNK